MGADGRCAIAIRLDAEQATAEQIAASQAANDSHRVLLAEAIARREQHRLWCSRCLVRPGHEEHRP